MLSPLCFPRNLNFSHAAPRSGRWSYKTRCRCRKTSACQSGALLRGLALCRELSAGRPPEFSLKERRKENRTRDIGGTLWNWPSTNSASAHILKLARPPGTSGKTAPPKLASKGIYGKPGKRPDGREKLVEADLTDESNAWLRLRYHANEEPVDYRIRLVTTTPNYGGRRWWFICPLLRRDGGAPRRVRSPIFLLVKSISEAGRAMN